MSEEKRELLMRLAPKTLALLESLAGEENFGQRPAVEALEELDALDMADCSPWDVPGVWIYTPPRATRDFG